MLYIFPEIIVPVSGLIPVVINIKKKLFRRKEYAFILCYLLITFFINALNLYIGVILHHNNLLSMHLYTICEIILLLSFFKAILTPIINDPVIKILRVIIPGLAVINLIFLQPGQRFNTYIRSVEAIIIVVYACIFLYFQIKSKANKRWYAKTLIWINVGLLVYYGNALCQLSMANLIIANLSLGDQYFFGYLNAILVFFMFVCLTIGFCFEKLPG